MRQFTAVLLLLTCPLPCFGADEDRPRLRDLGIVPGVLDPGPLNAITDVTGFQGHTREAFPVERLREMTERRQHHEPVHRNASQ